MNFITQEQLVAAIHTWMRNKGRPLGEILLEAKALSPDTHTLLAALVNKHLELHGNDPGKSLAALGTGRSACEGVQQVAGLAQAVGDGRGGGDTLCTVAGAAGAPASPGQRFRVLRPHARGGLGEVFVGHDEEVHREVALKEIQICHADDPPSRARFLREAEITARLEHPGIVPVYGLGYHPDGRPFYAMRFIRGRSLQEAIEDFHKADVPGRDAKERALELRKLIGRFLVVCDAVAYAHSRGVLHRDLKPANVMLGPFGETLVVDWGLAKLMNEPQDICEVEGVLKPALASDSGVTQAGSSLGTPAYMSPEQAAGRLDQLGPPSDIYSLGATLYCLLTGQAPFTDRDVGLLCQKGRRSEFPPSQEVKRGIPPALEAICLKAMAPQPEMRHASARELADDIDRWLADEPYSALRDIVFALTSEGNFSSLSSAFETVTGWSRAEWLGKPFGPLLHPEDLPGALERFQRALEGVTPPVQEARLLTRSGAYIRIDYMSMLQIHDGKTTGLLGIAREIPDPAPAQRGTATRPRTAHRGRETMAGLPRPDRLTAPAFRGPEVFSSFGGDGA
jgi:serine/threonine-protein kinase